LLMKFVADAGSVMNSEKRAYRSRLFHTCASQKGFPNRTVALSFCDENLPDGTYRDFLSLRDMELKTPRFIVTMMNGEWESSP